jgi:hypothetical protein
MRPVLGHGDAQADEVVLHGLGHENLARTAEVKSNLRGT